MNKVSKKHRYMITVLILGLVFSVGIYIRDRENANPKNGNCLERNEYGEGDYEASLHVGYEDSSKDIKVLIKEREYTKEELDRLSESAYEKIKTLLLNGNQSFENVSKDMYFPLKIPEYPFDLRWSVSDEKIIDRTGKIICKEGCMDTHNIIVSVALIYKEYRQYFNFEIRIVPSIYEPKEIRFFEIQRKIDEVVDNSINSKIVCLPQEYEGSKLSYSLKIPYSSIVMLILTFVFSVGIGICTEYDEKKKKRKMREDLERGYASFVERMKLYLLSGLTIKSSFYRIQKNLETDDSAENRELLVRIKGACNKYSNGCIEETIINEFGVECEGSYRKLSYLLSVNLKKGNSRLIELLNEEVIKANAARKESARKKGDEASIKLLFPMMSMLLIVMALIILPAYMDF